MSSKRHSMPVGPRPLQLGNGSASDGLPSAPLTASFSSPLSPSTPTTPNGGPRRASSIVYNPTTRPARTAGHRSGLQRSNSVGGTLDLQKSAQERSPVTLTEKHADLLHFIAQKESKCLELRSQLAMHEAELLQLKRKWERIVSRGFMSPHNASTPTSLASNHDSANGGAVLDGIREGVQGVGRFIAALSPTGATYHTSLESAAGFPLRSANGITTNGTHSKSSSLSTMATTTTTTSKSTRFSQSSQSSLGEDPAESETSSSSCPANTEDDADTSTGAEEEDGAQVLMVHDTGATPTMSPNPAFAARRDRDRERDRARQQQTGTGTEGDSSAEAEADFFFAQAQVQAASATGALPSPTRTPQTARPGAKRSVSGSPAIPGLGGLGLVDSAGVSAWVGSVGKNVSTKWEELQKVSTIAKNTKRASLLFSDIAYALQVGPAPSSSPSPTPSPAPSSRQPPSPSPSPALARSVSTSLLDDDDDGGLPGAPTLTPTLAPTPVSALSTLKPTPAPKSAPAPSLAPIPGTPARKPSLRTRQQQQQQQQQPQAQSPLSLAKSRTPPQKVPTPAQKHDDDDDDEWNW